MYPEMLGQGLLAVDHIGLCGSVYLGGGAHPAVAQGQSDQGCRLPNPGGFRSQGRASASGCLPLSIVHDDARQGGPVHDPSFPTGTAKTQKKEIHSELEGTRT